MIFLFVCCNTTTNKNIIETEISDFDKILDSFQVNGSILIYDNDKNTFYSNDFDWAKNGKLPASTDYSGINVPLVAVCNVPPVAQCNVPPQKWLQ